MVFAAQIGSELIDILLVVEIGSLVFGCERLVNDGVMQSFCCELAIGNFVVLLLMAF